MKFTPKKYNTRLDKNHIDTVALILYKARINCLNQYDPEGGDTAWSNGVRSCEWCRKAIRTASLEYDFIKILKDCGQSFVFSIDDVAVKFYKDNIKKPSSKLYKYQEIEQKQYELFPYEGINNPQDIRWRFVIETDIMLDVSKISFIGLNIKTKSIDCLYETDVVDKPVRIIASVDSQVEDDEQLEEIELSYKNEEKKEIVNG